MEALLAIAGFLVFVFVVMYIDHRNARPKHREKHAH